MATMTATQQFTASISPKDRRGRPAPVQNPTWASSDESVATVTPAADGLSALVVAQGVGSGKVNVLVDADLGEGVRTLAGSIDVIVTAGEAVSIAVEAGPAEEQPSGEPPVEPPVEPPPPPPSERRR